MWNTVLQNQLVLWLWLWWLSLVLNTKHGALFLQGVSISSLFPIVRRNTFVKSATEWEKMLFQLALMRVFFFFVERCRRQDGVCGTRKPPPPLKPDLLFGARELIDLRKYRTALRWKLLTVHVVVSCPRRCTKSWSSKGKPWHFCPRYLAILKNKNDKLSMRRLHWGRFYNLSQQNQGREGRGHLTSCFPLITAHWTSVTPLK